jgi:hypothetical protein
VLIVGAGAEHSSANHSICGDHEIAEFHSAPAGPKCKPKLFHVWEDDDGNQYLGCYRTKKCGWQEEIKPQLSGLVQKLGKFAKQLIISSAHGCVLRQGTALEETVRNVRYLL